MKKRPLQAVVILWFLHCVTLCCTLYFQRHAFTSNRIDRILCRVDVDICWDDSVLFLVEEGGCQSADSCEEGRGGSCTGRENDWCSKPCQRSTTHCPAGTHFV